MKRVVHLTGCALLLAAFSCSGEKDGAKDKSDQGDAGKGTRTPTTAVCKTMRYRPAVEQNTCQFSFKIPNDCSEAEGAYESLSECRSALGLPDAEEIFTPAAEHTAFAIDSVHLTRVLDCDDTPLDEWRFEFEGDSGVTVRFELAGALTAGQKATLDGSALTIQRLQKDPDGKEQSSAPPSGELTVDSFADGVLAMTVKTDLGEVGLLTGQVSGAYYLVPDSLCPAE